MDNYIIKNLQYNELPEAGIIFNDAFNSVGEAWNLETAIKRLEINYKEETCWAAFEDSKMVGILTAKLDYVYDHPELYIDIIAVLPGYQGKGIGKMLLNKAEEYIKSNNLAGYWLCAHPKLPSYNWYLKEGMIKSNWVVLYKGVSPT